MMWRLNLLAFVCCMALDNQYMLYYIWYVSFPSLLVTPRHSPSLPVSPAADRIRRPWLADLDLPLTTSATSTS